MSNNLKQESIKGAKWSAVERFSVQFVQFIIGIVLARLLSPEDFGIIGMIAIFIAIAQTFIDSGFSNALIRKINVNETDFSTVFYFNIIIGLLCYGVMFWASPVIAVFFNTPILQEIVKVISLNLLINSLTVVQIAKFSVEINFKSQAKASLISAIISGLIGIYFAYNGAGVWALVYQSVSCSLIKALLLWFYSTWKPRFIFSWLSFKELFSFGSKLLAAGLIGTLYANMSTLVIGKFFTSSDLGNYTRGHQFAALPSNNISNILMRVTYPILAKIQNDDERLVNAYRKYICITSILIFFGMTLLASLAEPTILLILSPKWSGAIVFLQIFCFGMMFDHINALNLNLLQIKGRSDLFLKLEILKKSISFSMLIAAIPLGVKAICLVSLIYTQIAIVINTYYTGKLFYLGYMEQMKDYLKYLICSITSCLPAYLLTLFCDIPWLTILLGTMIALCLYYLLLRKDMYMRESIQIFKTIIIKN